MIPVVIQFKTLYEGFSYTHMISSVVFYLIKGGSLYLKGRLSIFKRGVPKVLKGVVPNNFPGASPPDPHQSLPPHFVAAGAAVGLWGFTVSHLITLTCVVSLCGDKQTVGAQMFSLANP